MCLNIDSELTQKFKKKHNEFTYAYKVLEIRNVFDKKYLTGLYFTLFRWQPGFNKSNRKVKTLTRKEIKDKIIEKGIHVFLKKTDAQKESTKLNQFRSVYTIVRVKCFLQDLIAVGHRYGNDLSLEGVFMKVYVDKKELSKYV